MTGIERIAAERQRQMDAEGYTPEHDDQHERAELVGSALAYADVGRMQAIGLTAERSVFRWPWGSCDWKPSPDPIRNLEKAGALIAAEIDRLLRLR